MYLLHAALNPHLAEKPNLEALMIAHFRKQWKHASGGVRIGGLITHIISRFHISLVGRKEVPSGPTVLNRGVMVASRFLRPDRAHGGDHSYQCPLPNEEIVAVRLLLRQAFEVSTHQGWVLTLDQINQARRLLSGSRHRCWCQSRC